jgi:type I restriction enzyme S subunit
LYWFIANRKNIVNLSYGGGQPNISQDVIKKLKIPVPPLGVQNSIVTYLDKKNSEIDKFIRNKERLIEILEEQKKSEITRIIIEGISERPELVETDVPYMPQTSKLSSIKRLKYIASLKGRIGFHGLKTGDFTSEGPFLITGTDFNEGKINWDTCVHITMKRYKEDPYIQLKEGDFLITKDGTIGKTAIIEKLSYEASLNSGVMLVRSLRGEFLNKYLFWIINSRIFDEFVEITKTGSTIMHLYQHSFGNFKIPIPDLEIQNEIVKDIESIASKINLAISKAQKEISSIKEYREALITDLVTGKRSLNCDLE